MCALNRGGDRQGRLTSCCTFHEKVLFVKADVAAAFDRRDTVRHASIRTLGEPMVRLGAGWGPTSSGAAICQSSSRSCATTTGRGCQVQSQSPGLGGCVSRRSLAVSPRFRCSAVLRFVIERSDQAEAVSGDGAWARARSGS